MKIFIILLVSGWAWAADTRKSVVKVTSGLCSASKMKFKGSGFLFNDAGKSYVLTSEHVVLHGNAKYCHKVWNSSVGTYEASLRLAEYGNGLALLELTQVVADAQELNALTPSGISEGATLRVAGFPHGGDTAGEDLVFENKGTVKVAQSQRKLIPTVPWVVLVHGALGEFGMSGGPVFDEQGNFAAILSHQYIQLVPGGKSIIAEFAEGVKILENHLLVIPGSIAIDWVKTVLKAGDAASAFFVRDPKAQLSGKELVLSSGLRFEAMAKDDDDSPIGGDGGGTGCTGKGFTKSSVRISSEPNAVRTVWFLPSLDSWVAKVRDKLLLSWNTVEVPAFISKANDSLDVTAIYGLADFFQKLASPDLEPITLIQTTKPVHLEDKKIEEIGEIGKTLREVLTTLKATEQ